MKEYTGFIWSGNDWYIENDMAWFIDAQSNVLCCLDMRSGKCNSVAKIPNLGSDRFMLNTRCIKIDNEILCMPCYGDRIWMYNIVDATFQYIKLEKQDEIKPRMDFAWKHDNKVFAVSRGLRQVIVVDINTQKAVYYPIDVNKEDIMLSWCVKVETKIYCTSYNSNRVYQFDMDSKETVAYNIPIIDEKNLALICFDGEKFWLSGNRKKIYVWYKDKNIVRVIENFPRQFGNYNFFNNTEKIIDYESEEYDSQLFCQLKPVGQYIWAIPYLTNFVLYIDKDTFEVHILSIKNEEETKETLARRWKFKYFWQYLRSGRYMGIFSLKNDYIFEIDTVKLKEEPKNYILSDKCIRSMWNGEVLNEFVSIQKALFDRLIMSDERHEREEVLQNKIGNTIYNHLK